jgi:hypothetical protein
MRVRLASGIWKRPAEVSREDALEFVRTQIFQIRDIWGVISCRQKATGGRAAALTEGRQDQAGKHY